MEETCHSHHKRSKEHLNDATKLKEESHRVKHQQDKLSARNQLQGCKIDLVAEATTVALHFEDEVGGVRRKCARGETNRGNK